MRAVSLVLLRMFRITLLCWWMRQSRGGEGRRLADELGGEAGRLYTERCDVVTGCGTTTGWRLVVTMGEVLMYDVVLRVTTLDFIPVSGGPMRLALNSMPRNIFNGIQDDA